MAYERTIWKNREVERPRTYEKIENPDGTITLLPSEGTIIEEGTPIIAANMNNIEQGIEAAHNAIDAAHNAIDEHEADNTAHGVDTKIPKSLATAANQFLVSSGASNWVVKTIAQIKELLGLGSAAYTESSAYLPKTGGTMTGILTAQSNTSYTVRQVRNIILSTADANVGAMQNGDIWIKYK